MTDELMLVFGDDGIAREYKDDFDITIHCESKEEQEEVLKRLTRDDWTPCSETVDMPEHEVLCCDRYGEELIGWISYSDGQWLCESEGVLMYDPIAWMPLPAPYRDEE